MVSNQIKEVRSRSRRLVSGVKFRVVLLHVSVEGVLLQAVVEIAEDGRAFRVMGGGNESVVVGAMCVQSFVQQAGKILLGLLMNMSTLYSTKSHLRLFTF